LVVGARDLEREAILIRREAGAEQRCLGRLLSEKKKKNYG